MTITRIKTRRDNGSLRIQSEIQGPSMAQQQFAEECDANFIMKKYSQTGEITHLARNQGVYADVSEIGDYQSALDTVMRAQDAFETVPAQLREKLQNDPQKFLEFIQNPENRDEMIKYGIIEAKRPEITLDDIKNEIKSIKKTTSKSEPDQASKSDPKTSRE